MANFDKVAERIGGAKAIAWDQCHKIYLVMDDEQVEAMRGYHYDPIITSDEMLPEDMLEKVKEWYARSCGLRFVQAVSTNHEDPNAGFDRLIGQGEDDEDDLSWPFDVPEPEVKTPYIVAVGELFGEIVFYGPFEDEDAAQDWAEREVRHTAPWWLTELNNPQGL